jgi:signal transduction histidine kinase
VSIETGAPMVAGDTAMIQRIVENLLSNSVRHTAPATPIWIRALPDDHGVVLIVEDAGSGVPDAEKERIFQPFQQGSGVPRHSPGIGVGLSLVARFAELHGGRAWVEDRPGGGASFRVLLPAAPAEAPTRSVPASAS